MTQEALKQTQEPVALPCCGYADASAIKWNPYNQVVHCHNCGQIYTIPLQRTEQLCCQKYDTCLEPCTPRGEHLAQRTWVDLTNEDWNEIFDTALNKVEAIKLTKAKFKEKNT